MCEYNADARGGSARPQPGPGGHHYPRPIPSGHSPDYSRIRILLEAVRSAAVTGNQLRDRQAIRVSSSTNVTFARNEATGGPNGVVQVLVVDSTRIDIDSNRIDTGYGISIGADRAR